MHHIAVLDDVGLALGSHFARLFRLLLSAKFGEVVIGDGLSPDEALFEITMDDASGLGRAPALLLSSRRASLSDRR